MNPEWFARYYLAASSMHKNGTLASMPMTLWPGQFSLVGKFVNVQARRKVSARSRLVPSKKGDHLASVDLLASVKKSYEQREYGKTS
jgi:hypothetical protein